MKQILIAIVILITVGVCGFLIGNQTETRPLGYFGGGGDVYFTADMTQATTSASVCKRSIYRPTSTDDYYWVCATSTYSGTPSLIVPDSNGARQSLEIYTSENLRIWFTNTTSTTMIAGTNSDGVLIASGKKWNMKDYGIIWTGKIYGMGVTATSTIQYIEGR